MVVFGAALSHARDPVDVVANGSNTTSTKVVNIKSFGAIGDVAAMETKAVQDSIDACHDAGEGLFAYWPSLSKSQA